MNTMNDSVTVEQFNVEYPDFSENSENPLRGHFYAVYVPVDARPKGTQVCTYIYKDKIEAMKTVKKTKKARFKHFEYYHEALRFAAAGIVDPPKTSVIVNGAISQDNPLTTQIANERLSPFKGPKPQDLVKLRKSIENGDLDYFQKTVWDNPRFLVSNGDTPSILQEGFRYNGLHVAAKARNAVLAESILSTISNPKFVGLLYGDDCRENNENRIQVLLDLYLNTPDKGLNETPLHFASKFGAADVVEVLVSFSQCDKTLKNKYGQTPDMLICDRVDNKEGISALKKKISSLLENNYYVPVLRAEDNSITPIIGEPFSPGKSPVANKDPLSPRLEIHAYAGPMNKENAEQFRKVWKTPPRTSTPIKSKLKKDSSLDSVLSLRYTDPVKGLERLGQKLATKLDVSWKEYWSFLDCFVDITSDEGLGLFENYLAARVAFIDKLADLTPEILDEPNVHKSLSTISDLCFHMQNCRLNDDSFEENKNISPYLCVEKACNVFANRLASEIYNRICDNFYVQRADADAIEAQVKQVELLVLSYMEDARFNKVNFAFLHSRLGEMTAQKLICFGDDDFSSEIFVPVSKFLTETIRAFDCFSSDDEGNYPKDNKPTSSKKQLICLMQAIVSNFNSETKMSCEIQDEKLCRETWNKLKECNCTFHFKRTRKNLGLTRNSSMKRFKSGIGNEVSKKLRFEEENRKVEDFGDSESDEEFFTPPSTPIIESEDEEFSEIELLSEVFIEDVKPTKTDCAVFKALTYSECRIDSDKYPSIYRWFHNVNLYSEAERESWTCIRIKHENSVCFSTPSQRQHQTNTSKVSYHTPTSNSWLRITGANSPKATIKRQH